MERRNREGARRQGVRERQLVQGQVRVEVFEVLEPADRNPGVADGVSRQGMIGIDRRHRRCITDHIQAASALLDELTELLIGTTRGALTRELLRDPRVAPPRTRQSAARIGILAWVAEA
jgi:hypothetical protein